MDYHLKDANEYIGKEVTIIVTGYVEDIELINDTIMCGCFGGLATPQLTGQRTILSVIATDTKVI